MTAFRIAAAALTAATLGWSGPAWAQARPDIDIKTDHAEITVDIDEKLRAWPALVADSLAEGRRWAARSRAEADKASKEMPELFKVAPRWTFERIYSFRSIVAGRYVSVIRHDGTFSGGAHPNSRYDTILWDDKEKKRISMRPFFKETADNGPAMTLLAGLIRHRVAIAKLARANEGGKETDRDRRTPEQYAAQDEWTIRQVRPTLIGLGPITLAPSTIKGRSSGLTVHFSRYDVDAYAAGEYTVFVPWTAFKAHLSPEGLAIFGGERPKADADAH